MKYKQGLQRNSINLGSTIQLKHQYRIFSKKHQTKDVVCYDRLLQHAELLLKQVLKALDII